MEQDGRGIAVNTTVYVSALALFPGLTEREEERAWFPLFAHALNCSRIPLAR